MTQYAILSDIHGQLARLHAAMSDARRRGATAFVCLGDVGTDPCYDLLRQANVQAAFGNYEVSGWDRLSPDNRLWVHAMPALLKGATFLAAHAVPYFPDPQLNDVNAVKDYLLDQGVKWKTLFPSLDVDQDARWLAWAELEKQDKRAFFHGHTHRQQIWRIDQGNQMTLVKENLLAVDSDAADSRSRYLVSVGSVGQPVEGIQPRYALYDEMTGQIELCRVD